MHTITGSDSSSASLKAWTCRSSGLLVGLGVELDPAAVALGHRVAVVVPDVDRRPDRPVGDRHHDRQAEARRRCTRLGHVEQPLAGRRRVRARAGRRRADADRQRRELRLDHEVLARRQLAGPDQVREPLDDVRLRRDRVGAMTSGRQQRDCLGDRARALDLPKHRRPPRASARRRTRPRRRRRCASPTAPGKRLADRRGDRRRARRAASARRTRRAGRRSAAAARGARRASSVAGTVTSRSARNRSHELAEPELVEAACRC